ncbi:3'-5' exonuclease [Comamonas thiooxydans]|uniref:3'-5' exonuclease n=1 Tax=Comamonas thiooxydans TaxID=363952 RepID=UPI000B40F787|nr:3'-5' exonuclease [Comamonas thiooxydans]
MYEKATQLAKALNRDLVAFDLEHTGGGCRKITEFGAVRVTPSGDVSSFGSLVQPGPGAVFMPFVTRLTGITAKTVADAPMWDAIFSRYVQVHKDALWFGFNSSSCDMPILRKDSERYGLDASVLRHVDLMRFGGLTGSLTDRIAKLWPKVPLSGAHRAEQDADFTMLLLEGLLATVDFADLILAKRICITQNVANSVEQGTAKVRPAQVKPDMSFLCKNGESRLGMPWLESERLWLTSMHGKGKTPTEIGNLNGRSAVDITAKLVELGLIEGALAETDKPV